MSYIKNTWVDGTTPLSASNLNHIENGISENATNLTTVKEDLNNLKSTAITSSNIDSAVKKSLDKLNVVTESNVQTVVDNVIDQKQIVTAETVQTQVNTAVQSAETKTIITNIVNEVVSSDYAKITYVDSAIAAAITSTLNKAV